MTEQQKLGQMRAQYTTYNVDTDQISTVPECTKIENTIPNEEQQSSDNTEPIYEQPLREGKTRTTNKKGERKPRARSNDIYESTNEYERINRLYSGYSYASNHGDNVSVASTAGEHQVVTPAAENGVFAWTNPIAITNDEDYAEIPSTSSQRPRSRVNDVYSWDTYSAANIFKDINNDTLGKPRLKKRRQRKCQWYTWLLVVVSFTALAIALWALMRSNKALQDSRRAGSTPYFQQIVGNDSSPKHVREDGKESEVNPDKNFPNIYDEIKKQVAILAKNYSKLFENVKNIKKEASAITNTLSTWKGNVNDLKQQMQKDNMRLSKANVSLWEKINGLKGPRGYNGTKGDTGAKGPVGPSGPPGPRGLSVTNCTRGSVTRTGLMTTPVIISSKVETAKEKLFDVLCTASHKSVTAQKGLPTNVAPNTKYTCYCNTPETKPPNVKNVECTMNYILCQIP